MYRLLITDDEETILNGIRLHFEDQPEFEISTADNKQQAIDLLENNEFDAVIADLMFPQAEDGLQVFNAASQQWYRPTILAMTAFDSVENAVASMQAGADDFVSKGFGLDELLIRIENLLKRQQEIRRLAIENEVLRQTVQQQFSDYQIIGSSEKMAEVMAKIKKIAADAYATCLLQGESGSGKDLLARTIHSLSSRNQAPFIPVNCAAIPATLLESELFGHEKGSFTGAYLTQQGKFEQANGGVIFLDEITELPMHLQAVLLRVLEEKEIYRIGGKRSIAIDIMILAASNQNLEKLVRDRRFREDLFFRLNVINIKIPPLRKRPEDIEPLALFFLDHLNRQRNKRLKLSKLALRVLQKYDYPGNVRELRNIIEDAFVFCSGKSILPADLRFNQHRQLKQNIKDKALQALTSGAIFKLPYQEALYQFEKQYLLQLLNKKKWKINETAREIGLSREWLSRKIKYLGLKKPNHGK